MNQLKQILTVFALALLAACSQDDAFTGIPEGADAETVAVTLTAQADCSMTEAGNAAEASAQRAATRADGTDGTADPMPTRYYAEAIARDNQETTGVIEGTVNGSGGYDFHFRLMPGKMYYFLFWADNADNADAPTDLTAAAYSEGTVAFAAHIEDTPESVSPTVTLQHVVAKVSLVTTEEIATATAISLKYPSATTYNVLTEESSGSARLTTSWSGTNVPAGGEVLTAYLLPNPADRTITVTVNGNEHTLVDVPLAANTHITLRGDLSGESDDFGAGHEGFTDNTDISW